MCRMLTVCFKDKKPIKIKTTYSIGAGNSLKKYFETEHVNWISGSLWKEGKAIFTINDEYVRVYDKH